MKLTLAVIAFVSILYPLFFAYIDKNFSINTLLIEFIFTLVRLSSITFIIYAVIGANNFLFRSPRSNGLRYVFELAVILFIVYWFLFAFVMFVDRPLTGSNPADPSLWTFRRYIGLYQLATIFIYMFLTGLNIYRLARQKEAQAAQLERAYAQVRLQALKSQVNPHFLFNSLSVLSSLVHVNAKLSEKFIHHLAKAYRYILEQKDLALVPLQEELDFLNAYFFLLQIRFDNKIQLQLQIDGDRLSYKLPPLTLQLLVENAVKHNKMSAQNPLTIHMFTTADTLSVENNISHRDQAESSTGVGLQNIQSRYAMLNEKKPVITIHDNKFVVQLPLIKPEYESSDH